MTYKNSCNSLNFSNGRLSPEVSTAKDGPEMVMDHDGVGLETKKDGENTEAGQSEPLSKPSLVDAKGAALKACFVIGSAALVIICLRNSLTWHVAR